MKKPKSPKSLLQLMEGVGLRYMGLIGAHPPSSLQDAYMHWDELSWRPPPQGLSHEEWWLLLKIKRGGTYQRVPLQDARGGRFQFSLPGRLLELLHEIDRGLGAEWNLPEEAVNPATRTEYIISSLMQESITSSLLEGAATTREVAKEMLKTGRLPRNLGERMVLNNYRTMQHIMEVRSESLSPALVLELHRRVAADSLEKVDAIGRLRRADENIQVMDMEGNVFHAPPPAHELPERLVAMCAFANGGAPGDPFIHPVLRAIILHFWLAYDHPFVDGNGRTARALFYWSILHSGYTLFEFISISQVLLRAPSKYSMAFLHTETDENDLTYFLLHQADVIKRAVQDLRDYVTQKTARLRTLEMRLHGLAELNHRQQALLARALRKPATRYTVASHRDSHGIVTQTARTDLMELVQRGLLEKIKRGNAFTFRAVADLEKKLSVAP